MRTRRFSVPSACVAAVALLVTIAAGAAERAAPDQGFTLFMGSDIEVNREHGLHLIRDFSKGSFLVRDQDALVRVPVTPSVQFKISRALKLSGSAVQVDGLKTERVYSVGRDPGRQAIANANAVAQAAQQAEVAASHLVEAIQNRETNLRDTSPAAAGGRAELQRAEQTAMANAARADNAVQSSATNSTASVEGMGADNYDVLTMSFKVSSAEVISDAYFVVIAQYRAPGDKPGYVRNWVYAEELDSLGDQPRRVFFKQGGFPPGFELLNHELHFYRHGRELASNVAAKAVPLTRDEAHEYLVLEYLAANSDATRGPSVALGLGRHELVPHYTDALLQREIFIKVDKAGRPQGAFRDKHCIQATADAFLDALVSRVRFKPALQAGKAVDGVAQVKIADLAL